MHVTFFGEFVVAVDFAQYFGQYLNRFNIKFWLRRMSATVFE